MERQFYCPKCQSRRWYWKTTRVTPAGWTSITEERAFCGDCGALCDEVPKPPLSLQQQTENSILLAFLYFLLAVGCVGVGFYFQFQVVTSFGLVIGIAGGVGFALMGWYYLRKARKALSRQNLSVSECTRNLFKASVGMGGKARKAP